MAASIKSYDLDNEDKAFDFSNVPVQHRFARKVFTLQFFQLIAAFYTIRLFLYMDPLLSHLRQYPNLFWLSLFLMCVVYLSISCCENCRRVHPVDIIAFLMFSIAFVYFFCMAVIICNLKEFVISLGFTSIIYFTIILYLYQTDFPFLGFSTYLVLLITTFATYCALVVIDPNYVTVILLRGGIWSLIVSIYCVFDLQLMMRGTHFTRILSDDQYFAAALNIYSDVIKFIVEMLFVVFKP